MQAACNNKASNDQRNNESNDNAEKTGNMTGQLVHDTILVRKHFCTTDPMFILEKGHQTEPLDANRGNLHATCTQH